MIRNIIFDWSGTLVDDLPAVWEASNFIFREAGVAEMSLDQFRAEFCLPFKRFYDRYTPHIPLPKLESWFHAHFRESQGSVVALPHARQFLLFCQQHGIATYILSTVHSAYFDTQKAAAGLDGLLGRAYVQIWDKRDKIHELLTENHLDPAETMFIGDMQHDIDTAKHGGVFSCAVLTGYNHLEQLREAKPDVIVEHLGELQQILADHKFDLKGYLAGERFEQPKPIITVGAFIFNDAGQVLMVRTRKWSHLWGIPGGKTKYGETSEDALRRELKEETNLDVDQIEFILVQDCIHSKEFYREAHFVLLNYTCHCHGAPEVVLNDEAQEFRWLTLAEASDLALNQPTRTLLEEVQRRLLPLL